MPEFESQLPDHVPRRRLRRHGAQAVERAQAHASSRSSRRCSSGSRQHPRRSRAPAFLPPALPGGGHLPGGVRDRLDRRATRRSSRFAKQLQQKAAAERPVRVPAAHRREDRPAARRRSSSTATRSAPLGLDMQQVGQDLAALLGGNFVNRFNIDGPQLQGDPAGRSAPSASTPSSSRTSTSPGRTAQLMPLVAIATLKRQRGAALAQPLPAAQRGQDQRRGDPVARTRRSRSSRDAAAQDPARRATASTTPASRASCGRRAASSCPAMGLAVLLIFLVLAAQFNSFRDPFVILAGSVPLAHVRRADLHVPEDAGPRACRSSPTAGRPRSTSTRRSAWSRWSGSCRRTAS